MRERGGVMAKERRKCGVCFRGYLVESWDVRHVRMPGEKTPRECCVKCAGQMLKLIKGKKETK